MDRVPSITEVFMIGFVDWCGHLDAKVWLPNLVPWFGALCEIFDPTAKDCIDINVVINSSSGSDVIIDQEDGDQVQFVK